MRWLAFVRTQPNLSFCYSVFRLVVCKLCMGRKNIERQEVHIDFGFLVLYVMNMPPKILREIKSKSCATRLHHFSTVIVFI